jgi:putative tryptophan/tyrosine transport system substrate-binding protein
MFTIFITLLAVYSPAHAQKQTIMPHIGILRAGSPPTDGTPDVFIRGLQNLGYIEGKNIIFEIRYADGNRDRLREFATELIQIKVDAIFTSSSPAIFAFKQGTTTIPIVIVSATDPMQSGMVVSLAKPGGNITGMSLIAADLWPKRLELIKKSFQRSHVWPCFGIRAIPAWQLRRKRPKKRRDRWESFCRIEE